MLAKVDSGAVVGVDSLLVQVEVDITKKGFGSFKVVGLAGKAIDEAKERVRTAIENSGLEFTRYRLTVNLAPADLPKEGPTYDLPMAVGVLLAMQKIAESEYIHESLFVGELSLDGTLSSTPAILPLTLLAKNQNKKRIFVPEVNASESSIVNEIEIFPVKNLAQLVLHLNESNHISPVKSLDFSETRQNPIENGVFLEDIRGQNYAKRALIIASAGGHNIMFNGPPGAGKTFMARVLPSLLPPLSFSEALEVSKIHSIIHRLNPKDPLITKRPFRSPHHSISRVGLIGGGSNLHPGEISLAHRGVLFLDEIPEFPRSVLESLRQPMEDGIVTVSRAKGSITFPASFMLVAASNPCPCGYYGSEKKPCVCPPTKLLSYQRRLSGPLLDRIDLHTFVKAVQIRDLLDSQETQTTHENETQKAKISIKKARKIQTERFKDTSIHTNAEMNAQQISKFCPLNEAIQNTLANAADRLQLSARSVHKTIKVARTIADMDEQENINEQHLLEALGYRKTEL